MKLIHYYTGIAGFNLQLKILPGLFSMGIVRLHDLRKKIFPELCAISKEKNISLFFSFPFQSNFKHMLMPYPRIYVIVDC